MQIRPGLALLACLALAAPGAAAPPPAPDAPGPFAVGHTSFRVTDASRNGRRLVVDAWYPVDPAAASGPPAVYRLLVVALESERAVEDAPVSGAGPFPLIVFSHGNGGVRFQSIFLTETLASHGFVVVAPDHTGNTLVDFLLGDPSEEDVYQSAIDRPRDVSFLIDEMLSRNAEAEDPFAGAIDPGRIGVTGHSFGGFTALAMAAGWNGERAGEFGIELPDDFEPIPPDPRVRAIVPIAPASTPFGDAELAAIRIPTLLVGGTSDVTTPVEEEITRPFSWIGARPLYRADLIRAGHFSFTEFCALIEALDDVELPPDLREIVDDAIEGPYEEGCAPALIPIDEAHRLTNLFAISFFRRVLGGDPRPQRYLVEGFVEQAEPEVDFFRRPPR